jgi:diguanylate cyclase (GGDEF)-like protein
VRLQGKLVALLVPLVVGSLVGIGGAAYLQLLDNAERSYLRQVETLLDQITAQVQAKARTAGANAELFAANFLLEKYALIDDEEERYGLLQRPLLRMFASYQQAYPDYYEIRFLDPDGFEAARRVVGDIDNLDETEAHNPYFRTLATSSDEVYAEVGLNPDNGEVALYVGKPLRIRDPSVDPIMATPLLRGYLVITVRLRELSRQIADRPLGEAGYLFVTDAAGRLLFHDHPKHRAPALPDPTHSEQLEDADLRVLRAAFSRPGLVRIDFLGGWAHLQAREVLPGLFLYGAMPEATVEGATAQLRTTVFTITILTIVLFTGLLFVALRRLVLRPLRQLEEVAHQIGRGRLHVDISSTGSDEIASLARSFSGMAQSLAESNEQVRFLADHDSLTGLPNRRLFQDYLGRALAHAKHHDEKLAVLFLDVDEFKNVNDTLGHHAGDELLGQFAEVLVGILRAADFVARGRDVPSEMVARLGGDEFIILLPGLRDGSLAAKIAERILARLTEPFIINRQRFFVGASIGITVYPEDGGSVTDLVKHADLAMYDAKRRGKNNYQFFRFEMNESAVRRLQLERRLRQGLEREEFLLHFQPIIDLHTGRIVGAEALVRWQDRETGRLVPPDEFIPTAEASGLILPLGEWVLRESCRVAKSWQDRRLPRLQVAVNASALQIERGELSGKVQKVLEQTGLDAQWLGLELTETVIMSSAAQVRDDLLELQALGVTIALDDFGVGYSSLNYLRRFAIDKLKIDRSFVHGCSDLASQGSIVTAIIAMAHALGHKVVGEGIETRAELDFLRAHGCDLGQGYLFSAALPVAEFEALMVATADARKGGPASWGVRLDIDRALVPRSG